MISNNTTNNLLNKTRHICMTIAVKSKSDLDHLVSKKALCIISLFFIAALFSSSLIPDANGWLAPPSVIVKNEAELRDAINTSNGWIGLGNDIVLKESLEISDGKRIALAGSGGGYQRLIGAKGLDTIIVKSGGELTLQYGVVVTHAKGASGRGVYVENGGTLTLYNCEISGNTATEGGGVYNAGVFNIGSDGRIEDRMADVGVICGNTATQGGGVYNVGYFALYNKGVIRENKCVDTKTSMGEGGGVYNTGNFTMKNDVGNSYFYTLPKNDAGVSYYNVASSGISYNMATTGGGVYNVGNFNMNHGEIIYNTATEGGGVYNNGDFNINNFGYTNSIGDNTAVKGGGVYNVGNFNMNDGGWIRANKCVDTKNSLGVGGGVYNSGNFNMKADNIRYNAATNGGGVYNVGTFSTAGTICENIAMKRGGGVYTVDNVGTFDITNTRTAFIEMNVAASGDGDNVFTGIDEVFNENSDNGIEFFYLLTIIIIVVIAAIVMVIGLLIYRSKRQKQLMTKDLVDSNDDGAV
ncbi:MAG: hypothetical protein FWD52_02215 [Candidatus Bathyarchaeota archaeon]|nr:hypothetical protein [Candidatus Termiticorpusculum sp.]